MKDEYQNVDWGAGGQVHNWRNYICKDVSNIWHTFTKEQKLALVKNAEMLADQEEWG